jgi:DNA-binding response OmpR family regulator
MANERILIVEDNVALEGEPLAMKLEKAGYKVVGIAETVSDAVETARGKSPIVVLMDIALVDDEGKKDRLGGLRAARQVQAATGAEIVFVTGTLAEPEVLSEAQKMPGYEFLTKPVMEPQLLASVEAAVGRAKRNQSMTSARVIRAKETQGKFDVFLSHNSKDKAAVEKIAKRLVTVGIRPWLDKWNLSPGDTLSEALEKAVKTIPCAALCFGPADIGKWHILEIRAFVERWASGDARMIPVLLPDVTDTPELPMFVRQTVWVDMRNWETEDNDGFYRLVCGILARAPGNSSARKFGVRDVAEWQRLQF